MPEQILTEQSNPASTDIDLLSGRQIAELMNREDQKVAIAVAAETENIGRAVELIAAAFQKGGRLGYFGAGTSGRIGILDASECPPTFGTAPELVQAFIAGGSRAIRQAVENAEDDADFARQDIAAFSPTAADIVVGISASGNACYINAVLEQARRRGAQTIAVATNPRAAFRQYADIFICPEVGPEVIAGSSRLKSGTAQKMILNMLTTGAMIRCGKTYKNHMIDVRVTNRKLHDRACRIIGEIAGISPAEAQKYLENSGNNVKLACVMATKNAGAEEAQKLLNRKNGILRRIL